MGKARMYSTKMSMKAVRVRLSEQKPTRSDERGLAQVVVPQVAYRRAEVSRNELRQADILALQRTVGNRRVQQMIVRCNAAANSQQLNQRVIKNAKGQTGSAQLAASVPNNAYKPDRQVESQIKQIPTFGRNSEALQRQPAAATGAQTEAMPSVAAHKKPWLTAELKRKWIAVVLAEAAPNNQAQEEAFAWVYYNRIDQKEGEQGLRGSSAYLGKQARYAIWLYKQGDVTLGKHPIPKWLRNQNPNEFIGAKGASLETVEAVCTDEKGTYQLAQNEARLTRVRNQIEAILKDPSKNPVEHFTGQGNLQDFNNLSNNDPMWRKARYYYSLQQTQKGIDEWVKFYPATPARHSQFIFRLDKIEAYLKDKGIKRIADVPVPFVDVREKKAVFVEANEEISALPQKAKAETSSKPIQRQAATDTSSAATSTAPAKSWSEVKKSTQPVVVGKTLQQVEEIIGGTQYMQVSDVTKGVALMLVPIFRELASDDFKGLEYESDMGVDQDQFRKQVQTVKEYLVKQLNDHTKKVQDQWVADAVKKTLTETIAKEKPEKPEEVKKQIAELTDAARKKMESDPALLKHISDMARAELANDLASRSAATLCFFIAHYIYYRAINRIGATVSFAQWYKTQLLRGHVGKTSAGGLALGKVRGSPVEKQGLQEYDKLDSIPATVRLAISKQRYREWTDRNGITRVSEHYLLIFKDSDGHWRNLDHVQTTGPWHGEPTAPERVLQVWCVPTMTATELPTAAPSSAIKSSSLPQTATPDEHQLIQNFMQMNVASPNTQ